MMKILDVAEFYSAAGGGVKTYIEQKFRAAKTHGRQLVVVAPGREDKTVLREDGGKLIWVKAPVIPFDHRYHLFFDGKAIDEIVEAEKPDLIEASSPWRGAWLAGRQRRNVPKALIVHQDPVLSYPHAVFGKVMSAEAIDRSFAWFFKYFSRLQSHFDATVVSSVWLADRLESLGMKRPVVVPFGVEKAHFLKAERSAQMRQTMLQRCGATDPRTTLFFVVCRLHPEKRVPVLLDAFARASKRAPIALYHVGDGPFRRKYQAMAATTPGACLSGPNWDRDEIASMYASADAYVHACPNETFGMTLAEAMSAGAVLIAPEAGGANELVRLAQGRHVRPDDAADLADAMVEFCQTDEARRHALRQAARQAAPNITDHFDNLFSVYDGLIDQRGPMSPLAATGSAWRGASGRKAVAEASI